MPYSSLITYYAFFVAFHALPQLGLDYAYENSYFPTLSTLKESLNLKLDNPP